MSPGISNWFFCPWKIRYKYHTKLGSQSVVNPHSQKQNLQLPSLHWIMRTTSMSNPSYPWLHLWIIPPADPTWWEYPCKSLGWSPLWPLFWLTLSETRIKRGCPNKVRTVRAEMGREALTAYSVPYLDYSCRSGKDGSKISATCSIGPPRPRSIRNVRIREIAELYSSPSSLLVSRAEVSEPGCWPSSVLYRGSWAEIWYGLVAFIYPIYLYTHLAYMFA